MRSSPRQRILQRTAEEVVQIATHGPVQKHTMERVFFFNTADPEAHL